MMLSYNQLQVALELAKIDNVELREAIAEQEKKIDKLENVLHAYEKHIEGLGNYAKQGEKRD